jgi:hypothetical protein
MQLQEDEMAVRKSYSIPKNIAEMLEVEARRRDVNPSALLTHLLKKSLTSDLPLQRIGTVTVPEPCFQAIVDNISLDKLQEVAGEQSDKNFGLLLSLLDGQHNLESVIQSYYEKFGRYSGWYSFKHITADNNNEGIHQLILQHTEG